MTDRRSPPDPPGGLSPLAGRGALVATFCVVTLVHLLLAGPMRVPVIHPDELGYLSAARYLAGVGRTPLGDYYPGYAAVFAPFGRLAGDPLQLYRVALTTNAVLAGLTAVLAVLLARRLLPGRPGTALAAALAACSYPAVALWPDLAISENLLIPLVLLVLLATWRAARTARAGAWAAAGGVAGAAVLVHPRALALPLAVTFVAVAVLRPWRRAGRAAALAAAGAAALVTAAAFAAAGYVGRAAPAANRSYAVSGRLGRTASTGAIGRIAIEAVGQLWYLTTASAGLVPLAIVVAAGALWRLGRRPHRDGSEPDEEGRATPHALARDATLGVLVLAGAALLILSATFVDSDRRIDYLIYGRYVEVLMVPLVIVGLTALGPLSRRHPGRLVLAGAAVPAALGALLVAGRGATTFRLPVVRSNVFGLDALLRADHLLLRVPVITAVAALAAAVLIGAVRLGRRSGATLASGLAAAVFLPSIVTGQHFLVAGSTQRATEQVVPNTISALRHQLRLPVRCVGYDSTTTSTFHAAAYRLELPDILITDYEPGRRPPCSALVISGSPALGQVEPGARLVVQENSSEQRLWSLPGRLQDELGATGWLAGDPPDVALGPDGMRFTQQVADPVRSITLRAGQSRTFHLRIANDSRSPWPNVYGLGTQVHAVRVGARWYPVDAAGTPADAPIDDTLRAELPATLLPGQTASVAFTLRLPTAHRLAAGTYEVRIMPVQDGVAWFDGGGIPLTVRTTVAP